MELMKVQTARFKEVVEKSGVPEVLTLWQDPKKDKSFQKILGEERLLTVHQTVVASQKHFAEVGYRPSPNATYLVFPKSLKPFAGKRIVGIDYQLLKASESAPRAKSQKKQRTAPDQGKRPSPPSLRTLLRVVQEKHAGEGSKSEPGTKKKEP